MTEERVGRANARSACQTTGEKIDYSNRQPLDRSATQKGGTPMEQRNPLSGVPGLTPVSVNFELPLHLPVGLKVSGHITHASSDYGHVLYRKSVVRS